MRDDRGDDGRVGRGKERSSSPTEKNFNVVVTLVGQN